MRILIDITHPAHLHFFRNLVHQLENEGHQVLLTGRDKDILVELAEGYGLEVDVFGVAKKGLLSLAQELLYRQWLLLGLIRRFRPDIMMAVAGTFISSLGRLTRVPTYVFYDTEHATISNLLAYPFATCTYVPRCYYKEVRWRHNRYNGYHELAYLHPNYFTPDSHVLEEVGLKKGELFTFLRFVGWGAAHDMGKKGLSADDKMQVIEELGRHSRLLISAEGDLPASIENLRLRFDVGRIHHLMAHAALILGEGATMISEGAMLGVPGVYINPLRVGTLEEQERDYGMVFNFRPSEIDQAINRATSILKDYDRARWKEIGRRIVEDKIDVSEMLYRIVLERPYWKEKTSTTT